MKNRKDNKKRNLRSGEYQKSDGRYEYRYTDDFGKSRSVYSFRLVPTDIDPSGDTSTPSLREMESEIVRGERRVTDKRTLDEAFEDYILVAPCREHVRGMKRYQYNRHIKATLGGMDISVITNEDILRFYRHLGIELGLSASYIEEMHSIINGIFRNELCNRRVLYNPAENLGKALKFIGKKKASDRRALIPEEQEAFLYALEQSDISSVVKCLLMFLLGTGCRISEALSLCWDDIDFSQEEIHINRSFVCDICDDGHYKRRLSETKSESGNRIIPMIKSVRETLADVFEITRELRKRSGNNYIFLNPSGVPYTRGNIDIMIRRVRDSYNKGELGFYGDITQLPPLSAHILRHTFCTRLCESVTDMSGLKTVSEIMGHANVDMTLNVYTSVNEKKKKKSMKLLEDGIRL